MKNTQAVKLFLVVLLCTSYIVSFSTFGSLSYGKLVNGDKTFPEGTTVAQIDIAGKTKQEVLQILHENEQMWASETTINIHYKELQEQLELPAFHFLLEETVNQITLGEDNFYVVNIDNTELEQMQILVGTDNELDKIKLEQALISLAAQLKSGTQTVKLEDYLTVPPEEGTIAEATVKNIGQLQHLQRWVEQFPTIELAPYERFSILSFLKEHDEKAYPNETLSTIATALYAIILPTNFPIVERQTSRELPPYAQQGMEAKVDQQKGMDFAIMNPNDQSYTIESKIMNDGLHIALIGQSFKYTYKIVFSNKELVNKKTIIHYDPLLSRGQTRIKIEGKDGFVIKVFRETISETGLVIKKQPLYEDYYAPIHRIELRSLIEEEQENMNNEDSLINSEQQTDIHVVTNEQSEDDNSDTNDQLDENEEDF